jgi:hypothetical protein
VKCQRLHFIKRRGEIMKKTGICPICNNEMGKNNRTGEYFCETCNQIYVKRATCNKCGKEVELLSACGALQFFCNTCNELKSKNSVNFFFKKK